MARTTREVAVEPEDGTSLTALEIMTACAQHPEDTKPKAFVKMNGEIKKLVFKVVSGE